MSKKPSYKDLTEKMLNAPLSITQNWDILCSYGINKVNEIFVREHTKNPLLADAKFAVKHEVAGTSIVYTRIFYVELGNPVIAFLDGLKGQCKVELPINDRSTMTTVVEGQEKPTEMKIPAGHKISMIVPLVNIRDNEKIEGSQIIEFGQHTEASIALHFGIGLAGSTIKCEPEPPPTDDMFADLITGFSRNTKEVNYNIVKMKANSEFQAPGIKLTPKSFIFTSSGSGDDGVLSIWVQTNESGFDKGNANPVFQLSAKEILPVPQGHNSSVIFAKKLIQEKYIQPAFDNAGLPVELTDQDAAGSRVNGISIKVHPPEYRKVLRHHEKTTFSEHTFEADDLLLNYQQNPIYIRFHTDMVNITWSWEQIILYEDSSYSMFGRGPVLKGKAKITAKIDKNSKIDSKLDDENFAINIDYASSDVIASTESVGGDEVWEGILGVFHRDNEKLRNDLRDSVKNISNLKVPLGSLNYFTEANIIFEEKVFRADTNIGISICGDLIIVGDIT